jgi:hypothetical protein
MSTAVWRGSKHTSGSDLHPVTPLERRAVSPFYLRMMGCNAIDNAAALWDELVATGQAVTLDEARWLLNVGAWRPVVMGAWFSTRFSAAEIGPTLKRAMASSQGSLTAPPLAAACVAVLGAAALEEMGQYVRLDPGGGGSAQIVAAGIRLLGAESADAMTDGDDETFRQLLDIAARLREALA